ncbi:hypothetical protein OG497_37630 [Streptomyces sp. NBC_01242]|uniref:hypothetical protein n=1 Tax=Streptomyces sp. NBC_01242 TaxID=2903795 RepID=UPI00225792AA|nr:hypothetical protein [Streptomyces sp. NBC_01242]MCX4799579.1 hypothetical protein [Streptomyces sp. NBC_01242]
MTQPEPTLAQLWTMIERDSERTRVHVQETLDEVKRRLDGFMTKELWEAEKRVLEQRISQAEEELRAQETRHTALKEKLELEARAAAAAAAQQIRSRRQSSREFIYKGIIPVLALVIAALSIYFSSK